MSGMNGRPCFPHRIHKVNYSNSFTWQQRCVLPAVLGEPLPYHRPII